jgi:hypothetical protein
MLEIVKSLYEKKIDLESSCGDFWEIKTKLLENLKKYLNKEFKDYRDPKFGSNGEIAVPIKDRKGWTIVVNGRLWEKRFKDCRDLQFGSNGEIAVPIKDEEGWTIAVNGRLWEKRFEDCGDLKFGPDGKKIMVVIKEKRKYYRLVKEI